MGPIAIAGRIGVGLLGGWSFTWGFSVLGITALVALGQPYDEAHTAVMLLAFLVFLGVFCWSFTTGSVVRAWGALVGGAALMTGGAWLIQQALI